MRTLYLFMMISLDGYFEGKNHDLSWHNANNEEFQNFVAKQNATIDTILMGKTTYEMMRDFWPSEDAQTTDPLTAEFMSTTKKYVFSHEPYEPKWENAETIHEDINVRVQALKEEPGKDIAIFGSNILAVSLMEAGLVDEFRIMINPIAIGAGTPLFHGITKPLQLSLTATTQFQSGNVLTIYKNT
ncbi:MAG: dihydrofolate reductase family protein [Candidatus Andersenbacteria bacterium]|nr:dihydrofolate reductase family protein [Candidatus Andersenbacteria bacterium]